MKFSESWLREWVNPSASTADLIEKLTMAGLEVDGVEKVAGSFSGVVVGQIIEANQHPDADKLRVCKVLGPDNEEFNVVCGAPNARAGIKIPFAMIGAKLPGDFKIKKAKLRGVESFGMLCAQTELEAGDDDAGLWELAEDAPTGQDLRTYLDLDDNIIEVDLTPNRSDCLGIKGIARETGVLFREDVKEPKIEAVVPSIDELISVELASEIDCPRYFGRVIEGVNVGASSPLWMQEKLRRSDIRPIDAIVDVTNYVLLELGQPMHAFDKDKLAGGIIVRQSEPGETLALLNGSEIELQEGSLVIADQSGPLALAGVMGGASSAVSSDTKNIFLEAAFFNPISISGKARSYGLHTDSSHRFERGVDYELAEQALERATQLILDIAGGQAGPVIKAEDTAALPSEKTIVLRKARIEQGLGLAIPDTDVEEIIQRLGLDLISLGDSSWEFRVPSYRFDISIEEDLLEELARIYGYNNLPTTTNLIPQILPTKSESVVERELIANQLVSRDYMEVITYSFIDPAMHSLFFGDAQAVELLNPISADLSVMRTSLLPGLFKTLISNVNRQHSRVRIFERGLRFASAAEGGQTEGIAGLIYGETHEKTWVDSKDDVDFYDIKGDLCTLLDVGGRDFEFETLTDLPFMHPGQCATLKIDGEGVGFVGALHPEITKSQGLTKPVYAFEVDLAPLLTSSVPKFLGISRYPEVERDLAFVVPRNVLAGNMKEAISSVAGENLKQLKVFDIYSGEGIDSERKSIAFHLTFQHSSRTLNEDEVNAAVDAVVTHVEGEFGGALR